MSWTFDEWWKRYVNWSYRTSLEGLLTAVFPVDWYKFRTYQPDLDERWCQYAEGVIKSKLEAELARTAPPRACHAMITPETSCELPKGHSGEHSGATPEPPAPGALRTWIAGAQFMVTPKEAPDGNAPLHVVTVEGLLKWLDEREIAPHHRWPSVRNKADTAVLRDTKEQG